MSFAIHAGEESTSPFIELQKGEFLIGDGYMKTDFDQLDKDTSYQPFPENIVAFCEDSNSQQTYKRGECLGTGGLGVVYEYSDGDNFLAVKITTIDVSEDSDVWPSVSHHLTETLAPKRLRELSTSDDSSTGVDCFIETFIPHEKSINAIAISTDNDSGYTVGDENPITIFWGKHGKKRNLTEERFSVFDQVNFLKICIFTVMKKAKGSLMKYNITYDVANKVLDFFDKAQTQLSRLGYFYKDIKLDQILVMEDDTYRLGDIANLCHKDDGCEFGYFDDPSRWKWASIGFVNKWVPDETKKNNEDRERGLKWQRCMFVCELACAIHEELPNSNSIVYKLAPHLWEYTSPEDVSNNFEGMIVQLRRNGNDSLFGNARVEAIDCLTEYKAKISLNVAA